MAFLWYDKFMSNTNTIKNIKANELPLALAEKLGLKHGDVVDLTVTPSTPEKKFDVEAFKRGIEEMRRLPVLDDRSADEIIGYDEHGLPT